MATDKKADTKTAPAKATKKVAAKPTPPVEVVTPKVASTKKVAPVAKEETPPVTPPTPAAPPPVVSGFMKPLTPSAALAAIVGEAALPRTEVVKKMWVYIKANNLQDANKKSVINADDKLKAVFGKDQVGMFEMQKFLSQHLK